MCALLAGTCGGIAVADPISALLGLLAAVWPYVLIFIGFSVVIFVHELGHFLVAKWCGIRVEKFAIGFFREVFGFTRGETRYSFNILPLGGYVKMLGQEDFEIDKSWELRVKDDPRAFSNKPVGYRMLVVSAGVVMNVIFAGLLFMIVFMVGKQGGATEVGFLKPNWPAALSGLEPGDVIERVDGKQIDEFVELNYAIMLADPLEPLDFEVRRRGELKHFRITPLNNEDEGLLQVGVMPAVTRTIGAVGPSFDPNRADHLQVNDVVVELNGQAVTDANANEMMWRLMSTAYDVKEVVVERPVSAKPGAATERVHVHLPVQFGIYPSDPTDRDALRAHILGLAPLARVAAVHEGGRAELGGLLAGDIVLKWGDRRFPTYGDIAESIRQHGEIDIPVVVERQGKPVALTIRPKVKHTLFGSAGRPSIGAELNTNATDLLRIAAVAETIDGRRSPAAESGIQPGALITHVNDGPVSTWLELIDHFRANAGSAVTLTYDHERKKGLTCEFKVPRCLRTILGLPAHALITAIDGEENVQVNMEGRAHTFAVSSPFGLRELLKQKIGQTVTVTYAESPFAERRTAELAVTEDMVDPWLGRILYYVDVRPVQATKIIRKGPFGAIQLGAKKTAYFIVNVYTTMQRMIFSRSVGVENLSGPVGILKIGASVVQIGGVELLFFLAMISANLAVLNFLPLPIVDGGLMVFLLIEKIKGSPVNLKIQMATQVIGLILIGAVFVFVTLQDLAK
ncbi:MAG: site-2 protease family protein [Planctomycetota bacterium]